LYICYLLNPVLNVVTLLLDASEKPKESLIIRLNWKHNMVNCGPGTFTGTANLAFAFQVPLTPSNFRVIIVPDTIET
jgi:hypothetical protein